MAMMPRNWPDMLYDALFMALGCAHVLFSPYTKVEESFNMQAVHDILAHGFLVDALPKYDHITFPGAVPRTFVGAIVLAAISYPASLVDRLLGLAHTSADIQLAVRLVLSLLNTSCLLHFSRRVIGAQFGTSAHRCFVAITASQFHLLFWGGRTIPNSLALPLVLLGLSGILAPRTSAKASSETRKYLLSRLAPESFLSGIAFLTVAAVILRLEIIGMLAPAALWGLFIRRATFVQLLTYGASAGFTSLLLTVVTDTYFWQRPWTRPLWPELEGILFNVVEGKSADWGVSPAHAYVTTHLPKLLTFTLPLLLLGIMVDLRFWSLRNPSSGLLLLPAAHVALLSALGHKEWRFIVYVIPCLNGVAAVGLSWALRRSKKSPISALMALGACACVLLTAASTLFMTLISHYNYPGGEALAQFHASVAGTDTGAAVDQQNVTLHIDTLSAMTGVTLFQSLYLLRARSSSPLRSFFSSAFPLPLSASNSPNWTYDKSESLPSSGTPGRAAYGRYTHLLTGAPSCAVLFETSASASDGAQDSSNDETRAPLPANEQPFEPFTPPIRAYSGLRRRPVTEYSDSLRGALDMTGRRSFWQRLGGVLPFEIVFRDTIWLCVRKEDAGDESQVARSG